MQKILFYIKMNTYQNQSQVKNVYEKQTKHNKELFTFMYGSLVIRLTKDIEDPHEINKQLELIGYNIGQRIIDDIIDSFDTHADIPTHFEKVNAAALKGNNVALISAGWDPGMFSINRLYGGAILPSGRDYTFWGKGVSQGHSDAIRRIDGVKDARQYTCPVNKALEEVRSGSNPELTTREKHTRLCYVVAKDGANLQKIEEQIKTMPKYFADYDTTVNFISQEELNKNHSAIPHGGFVIRSGKTGENNQNTHIIEYSLKLDSNPEFTASVLVAYARAVMRMKNRGHSGCITVFDVTPADIHPLSREELIKNLL